MVITPFQNNNVFEAPSWMSETPLISFSHHFEEYFLVIESISGIHSSVYYKNATLHKLQNCLLQPVSCLRCTETGMQVAPWIVFCGYFLPWSFSWEEE